MNYGEVFDEFDCDGVIGILVKTDEGLKLLSEYNFTGGCCSCCSDFEVNDNLMVIKIINVETMEVLYQKSPE